MNQKEGLSYGLVLLLSFILLLFTYELWKADLTIPFAYAGDGIFYLGFVKGIVDNGWYLQNEFLGAPGKSELYDFPMGGDNFQHLCIKVLSFFTDNYVLVTNLYLLLTFPVTAAISFFVCRRFNVSRKVAVLISLLYAFTPYHLFRGVGHLMLSGYYMIPLGIMLIIFIVNGKAIFFAAKPESRTPRFDFSRRSIVAVLICTLIASTGVYYAFFQSLLMGILGTIASFQKKNWLIFLRTVTFCGIIFTVSVINIAPTILYQQEHGPNPMVGKRSYTESEYHGLRITQLLLPMSYHRSPSFSNIKGVYNQGVWLSENDWSTLGLAGSMGFVFLVITVLGQAKRYRYLLEPLSKLNIIAVLFATMSGFGALFSYLVIPNFRGQNRMSIIIAFLAIVAFGILIELVFRKIKWEWVKIAIIIALLAFGIWDQTAPQFVINQELIKPQFNLEKRFVEKIEESVPAQAMIFQIPYLHYPEGGQINYMQDYELLKGYFHSKQLRWSYGAMKGRKTKQPMLYISTLDPKYMVYYLHKLRFAGIYIDRNGYVDLAKELEAKLIEILNIQPLVSEDNRLSFFNFINFKPEIAARDYWKQELEIFNQDNASSIHPKYLIGDGWWINEGTHRWTNGYKAEMLLYVENPEKDLILNIQMFGLMNAAILPAQRVTVLLNGKEIGKLEVAEEKTYAVRLNRNLLNTSPSTLTFQLLDATTPQQLGINDDQRTLALAIQNASLQSAQD